MKNLVIKGKREEYFIPSVNFDAKTGHCELSGESYLEETVRFYSQLQNWLSEFLDTSSLPILFDFRLNYFNTSSSRCILDILSLLNDYKQKGKQMTINWYYDETEVDLEEIEDFVTESGIAMNIIDISS